MISKPSRIILFVWMLSLALLVNVMDPALLTAADLPEIKARGVIRHLGVPYAKFVTGSGDGFSTELVKLFAEDQGLRYEYVPSSWKTILTDLSGHTYRVKGDDVEITGSGPVKGDIIATGLTILPWRQQLVNYSTPTFPSAVWLIARSDSPLRPIQPTGSLESDIAAVKHLLKNQRVITIPGTCLDPQLYGLNETGAHPMPLPLSMNEIAPAVINRVAETCLLDVPDALIALEKWPGEIKIIGPVSPPQAMGCAFPKTSPQLMAAFNAFLAQLKQDGTYLRLVAKYYPGVFAYFDDFFKPQSHSTLAERE